MIGRKASHNLNSEIMRRVRIGGEESPMKPERARFLSEGEKSEG
jgi:hypothetical protein